MSTCFDAPSIYDGVPLATLQTWLSQLQQARIDVMAGNKVEIAGYAQGDGNKSVTYTRANLANLTMAILEVQTAIDKLTGMRINRRRPLVPYFGR